MPKKVRGKFVYASMPMKGLEDTLIAWRRIKRASQALFSHASLDLVLPGRFDFLGDKAPKLTLEDDGLGLRYVKTDLIGYRRAIASAEALFYVNRMPETFCCAAALAEAYGTRMHILCLNGFAGIEEAVSDFGSLHPVPETFDAQVVREYRLNIKSKKRSIQNSPDKLAVLWEELLEPKPEPVVSVESKFETEDLPENKKPFGPEFGTHLSLLKESIASGGSEMGLGLMLQALVASTRAHKVVEIGRFKGFSTLALASGLALADAGWQEPKFARQRPDVDYGRLLDQKLPRRLISIDPHPTPEAEALVEKAGLRNYVTFTNASSDDVKPEELGPIDILLIDGDHSVAAMRKDVARYVPHVKPGGYFILHDYFGWFSSTGENGSPIKKVIDEDLVGFERMLVDTGFASFVVFRNTTALSPQPVKVPPRTDGRPTVGLVLIAMGSEAATVVARAIVSAWKMVDAVTVVIDPAGGGEQTADVAKHMGADVYLRKTPAYDWDKGIGGIAGARNEAISIAERKTDYVLVLDADDTLEGEIPEELDKDLYEVMIHDGGAIYRRIQMWRSNMGFRYEGIIHEFLACSGSLGKAPGLKYIRRFGGGHQDSVPAAVKYTRHARLAAKWLIDHPEDARMQFYLAQSYRDAGRGDDAIREYEKRIVMQNGMEEEKAFSAFQIARIVRDSGKDPTAAYLRAYEMRPARAEPLCELASWLRSDDRKRFALGAVVAKRASEIPFPENDALFLDPSVYQFRALDEYAIHAYWAGDKQASRDAYEKLRSRAPDWYKPHIENMISMLVRELGK
jgi:hypothetical protein